MHSDFNSYTAGLVAEFRARMYLRLRGYSVLKTRYITGRNTGRAEIDIIARRGNLLLFIEVKRRPTAQIGLCAVTGTQSRRLRRAAETYIADHKWMGDARFDIIVVSGHKIEWVRGAI